MPAIVVELDAYVIPRDHQVYKFSAGKTYRFYRAVEGAHAAFLDVRGLDSLAGPPAEWKDKDVLSLIRDDRWSRELQSRRRGNKAKGDQHISAHDRKVWTFMKRLFFEAKRGDLIVVPPSDYTKNVMIGEVLSDPGVVTTVEAKDGEGTFRYVGRAVRWRPPFEKRLASTDLLQKLHNPNAIFTLGKSLRHEIYRHAYGDFVADGEFVSSFKTGKAKFTAEDSAVVSTWFNGYDVLRHAVATKQVGALPDSFFEMGLHQLADHDAAELRININSPGSFSMKSGDAFALSLMALFALSGCSSKAIIQDKVTVQLKTVGQADIGCQHQIESTVNELASALGPKRLEQACKLGVRAGKHAKISTSAHLQLKRRKRK